MSNLNLKKLLPAAMVMAVSLGLQSNVSAGILYPDPSQNIDLTDGNYVFAGAHPATTSFLDELQFSLASPGQVSATVANTSIDPAGVGGSASSLMDNHLLTVSLFDGEGNFITAAGAGHTLSATGLSTGITYTLAVSGKTTGIFGGVYGGSLTVGSEVPLPASLPVFASALVALGWRRRKGVNA